MTCVQAMAVAGMSSDGQRWSRASVDECQLSAAAVSSPRRHSSAVNGLYPAFYSLLVLRVLVLVL